ncbi:MAG: hypothetical protein JW857_03450 [Bacteroidales bacterium]|nr:hypothetical protein [Bacteroidales bacterium]
MKNKRLKFILTAIAVLLLIPFLAMQFTEEVNWTLSDFIAAGILLLGTGLICEFALRKIKDTKYRILACIIVILIFLVVWIELAVGIFGSPLAGS